MATQGNPNLPKGVHLPEIPKKDFIPHQATDDQLKAHGLPPRPKDTQPQKLARWHKILSGLKRFIVPTFESAGSYATTSKWAGAVVTDLKAGESFNGVEANWIVPCPYPPQANSGTYECNSWIGLDGYVQSTDLLRAGTLQTVSVKGNGEVTSRHAKAWCQWYPDERNVIPNFPVNFGDTIGCNIWSGEIVIIVPNREIRIPVTYVFFFNEGSGDWTSFFFKEFESEESDSERKKLKGDSAQWIMENPSQVMSPDSMASFGSTFFSNCFAVTNTWREEDLTNAQPIIMVTSNDAVTADAVKENTNVLGVFYRGPVLQ